MQCESCELISNYVLIFGSTTIDTLSVCHNPLWIDFKLCSYFWFDNRDVWVLVVLSVVNWFQIMFLFLVRQRRFPLIGSFVSCELISNYVLIFGSTTLTKKPCQSWQLWIDFKLCSYFWFDNLNRLPLQQQLVVNWFQIMFLFLVRQPPGFNCTSTHSCELISNYVLIFGSTTLCFLCSKGLWLWIDFKLCS